MTENNNTAEDSDSTKAIATITPEYLLSSFTLQQSQIAEFELNGFYVFPTVLDESFVEQLNHRLVYVLRVVYDTGSKPDKAPKLIKAPYEYSHHSPQPEFVECYNLDTNNNNLNAKTKRTSNVAPLAYSGNKRNVKVVQIINVHKSDHLFRKLATIETIGYMVAKLMKWTGALPKQIVTMH